MGYIKYKEKKYKTVRIDITKSSDFNALLKEFHNMYFTDLDSKLEHIRYAILELVNNSIRAHKEQKTNAPITIRFSVYDKYLEIIIRDSGGGFDIGRLPYDINRDVSDIDLNDSSFQDYREKHNYNRFGMGLLVTKRTFDYFHISFHDKEENDIPWDKEKTVGTIITMRSNYSNEP